MSDERLYALWVCAACENYVAAPTVERRHIEVAPGVILGATPLCAAPEHGAVPVPMEHLLVHA